MWENGEKKRMQIILISGKAGHGKDTAALYLRTMLEAEGERVLVTHYGDLLKYICKSFFGWDGVKDEKGRHLLQYVGTDTIREKFYADFWVDFVAFMLEISKDQWDYVLIPDCRYPNEIECMKVPGADVIHIQISRDNFVSQLTKEQQQHSSETALDNIKPDYYIRNNGSLHDLYIALSQWFEFYYTNYN
jgi:hypothetical protein